MNQPIPISSRSRIDGRNERRTEQSIRAPGSTDEQVASLAHEINNPLDTLLNLLYLLESEASLTKKGHSFLLLARQEVHRISQIAHTAMYEFRDKGASTSNVPRLLGNVVDLYRVRLEAQGISIVTRFCPGGDLAVFTGPLRQVFSNLLLNAADAMPHGGRLHARVSAAHEWQGEERQGLRVTMADNGTGIAAEKIPNIFEPFFTTKGDRGNGLGLSLVKSVVENHHGVVRVRSSTLRGHSGTVFTIFLPGALPA